MACAEEFAKSGSSTSEAISQLIATSKSRGGAGIREEHRRDRIFSEVFSGCAVSGVTSIHPEYADNVSWLVTAKSGTGARLDKNRKK